MPLVVGLLTLAIVTGWASEVQVHHIHGLSVDSGDPAIVYVATHTGLAKLAPGRRPELVGEHRFDLMGFTAHPSRQGLVWASGHPDLPTYHREGVANLGVLESRDGGATWRSVALRGKADFHALAWSPHDGGHLYGWSAAGESGFYRISATSSKVERLPTRGLADVSALAASPAPAGPLLAGTRRGLLASRDRGLTWLPVTGLPAGAPVTAVAFHRNDARVAYAFAAGAASVLFRSADSGRTWEKSALQREAQDPVIALAVGPGQQVVAATTSADVLRSGDGGGTWEVLLERGRSRTSSR